MLRFMKYQADVSLWAIPPSDSAHYAHIDLHDNVFSCPNFSI